MEEKKESGTLVFYITIIFYIAVLSLFNLLICGINYLFFTKTIVPTMFYISAGFIILAELRYGWCNSYIVKNVYKEIDIDNKPHINFINFIVGEVILSSYIIFIYIVIDSSNIHSILAKSLIISFVALFITYLISYWMEKKKDFERIKNDILSNQSGMPAEERLNLLAGEYGFNPSDFLKIPLISNMIAFQRENIDR